MSSERTNHPEWYSYTPLNNPLVNQSTFTCHRDGLLVIDLEEHDRHHEEQDAVNRETSSSSATPTATSPTLDAPPTERPAPSRITEPARPGVDETAATVKAPGSKPRGSSAGAPSPS